MTTVEVTPRCAVVTEANLESTLSCRAAIGTDTKAAVYMSGASLHESAIRKAETSGHISSTRELGNSSGLPPIATPKLARRGCAPINHFGDMIVDLNDYGQICLKENSTGQASSGLVDYWRAPVVKSCPAEQSGCYGAKF